MSLRISEEALEPEQGLYLDSPEGAPIPDLSLYSNLEKPHCQDQQIEKEQDEQGPNHNVDCLLDSFLFSHTVQRKTDLSVGY